MKKSKFFYSFVVKVVKGEALRAAWRWYRDRCAQHHLKLVVTRSNAHDI